MIKKIIGISLVVLSLLIIVPVFAESEVGGAVTTASSTADKIACVKGAVIARENAISLAFQTYTNTANAAYATRTNELTGAYLNSTVKTVQAGVKVSWADFNKSMKSANKKWTTDKNAAWTTFKAATKTCKSPVGVSDSANSTSEVKGQ
jgi:hypothetical protein